MTLPEAFLRCPIAHRALHDASEGRPENSRAAVRAAVTAGYGVEIDIQRSAEDAAMVFHDYHLDRLTGKAGVIGEHSTATLATLPLKHSSESVPTLPEVLEIVAGQAPLLIEIKDQDGGLGPDVGPLEAAVAHALQSYRGPVAVMSFNPHSVAAFAKLAPNVPRGLTTGPFLPKDWPGSTEQRLAALRPIPDLDRVGACFISHAWRDLDAAPVAAVQDRGLPILCWTTRSREEDAIARRIAMNVTFEGYSPA